VPVYAWLCDRDVDAVGFTFRTIASLSNDTEAAFDESLLARGVPVLSSRDGRYASDEVAWRAVLASPDLVIVPSPVRYCGAKWQASVLAHMSAPPPRTV